MVPGWVGQYEWSASSAIAGVASTGWGTEVQKNTLNVPFACCTVYIAPESITWAASATTDLAVIRFTAPQFGNYAINVTWGGGSGNTCRGGPNVVAYVRLNGAILPANIVLPPNNYQASASYVQSLVLSLGDTLDFMLGNQPGYDGACNTTGFSAAVTLN
jgi:hypothetical protein